MAGGRPGFGSNLTEEERQQMMQQRLEEERTACEGKAEGDQCTLTNPRGDMAGSCSTLNETLVCRVQFGGGQVPGSSGN